MRAGVRKGDVVISFHGVTDRMSESELLTQLGRGTMKGQQVKVTVMRGSKRMQFQIKLP